MKPLLITGAATAAALLVVLFDRIVFPSLVFAFRVIEASFAPDEPATPKALPVAVEPIVDVSASPPLTQEKPAPQPRKARRRKPSAATLARAEAALA